MRRRRWLLLSLIMISLVGAMAIGWRLYVDHKVYKLNLAGEAESGAMPAPLRGQKILIFAPHEDDETLGAAGYIQKAVAVGADVHVVLMTNGEYPEIDVFLFEETFRMQPEEFIRLGYIRQKETLAAMQFLGLSPDVVTFLGYPNQYLNQMWLPAHWLPSDPVESRRTRATRSPYNNSMTPDAVYCGQSMLQDVETVLMREQPDIVVTLHPNDVHVDHWPTGAVVRYALNELASSGADFARRSRMYTYLIHRDQWPAPRGYHPKLEPIPPTALAEINQTDWLRLPLTEDETLRKHKATALYRTQAGSVDPLLLAFSRKNELFGAVPIHEWPAGQDVPATVVIHDSVGDLDAVVADPHGDISRVTLQLENGGMTARVETRGTAAPRVCYHLSIHAGGASPENRVIAEYAWQGAKTGLLLKGGALHTIDPADMKTNVGENTSVLRTAWPLSGGKESFFMVRAWTTRGKRVIDQTATETFEIRGAE